MSITAIGSVPERETGAEKRGYDLRTRALIEGPIAATLLRLAAPNVLVMLAQASVGLVEIYFIGRLGTDSLAGVALVFPVVMLMQMMSAGAIGGGISSAIARALGGGRRADADALVLHALLIALAFGFVFTFALLAGGPWLYATMGGNGASLATAISYSDVIFAGAVLVWLFNSLANIIRGTGNMAFPAIVTVSGVAVLIPLSPCLIFGLGPFPRLGVVGGAGAIVVYYAIGSAVLAAYLRSTRSVVRFTFTAMRLRWSLFRDILRVGLVAALITVQTNLTVAIATRLNQILDIALGPLRCRKRSLVRFGSGRREHIVSRHRTSNTLERKLADRFDGYGLVNRLPHARADEDLTGLGFIAKAGGDIGHSANRCIIETALKPNRAECRKTMCYTDPEAKVVTKIAPFLNHCSDCGAHI